MISVDRINGVTGDLAIKTPVRVATTANITLSGLQTIDGVLLVADDRVLVKNQTDAVDNGIWSANTSSWSRALDFDGRFDVVQGTTVPVVLGTVNAGSAFKLDTASPVIGTSSLSFSVANDFALRADLASTASGKGAGLSGFSQAATYLANSVGAKLQDLLSVQDAPYLAAGDGVTSDQTAFASATALGVPVFVPYTPTHYVLSSLSAAQRKLLFGPGKIKVNGVYVPISSVASVGDAAMAGVGVVNHEQQPSTLTQAGAIYVETTRTGGLPNYGNILSQFKVTDSVGAGEFDVGVTSWISSTTLDGGANFAAWLGANTPARDFEGAAFSAGSSVGMEIDCGNRWNDFGYQNDIGGTRSTTGLLVVPAATAGAQNWNYTVTITAANPAVIGWTAHGLAANTPVVFAAGAGGTLPASIVAGTVYYVLAAGLAADTFRISATRGGSAISTASETIVNPITVQAFYPGSFGIVLAKSIVEETWWTGLYIREDTIQPTGVGMLLGGGSVASMAPTDGIALRNYYGDGIDLSTAFFSGNAIRLGANHSINFNGAAMAGAAGAINLTVTSGTIGALQSNSFGATNFSWSWDGTNMRNGFYGAAPAVKQAVTGSRGGNAALASLLTALSTIGLITDSSS